MKSLIALLLLAIPLIGCDDKDIQPGLARLGTVKENIGEIRVISVNLDQDSSFIVDTFQVPAQTYSPAQIYIYESEIRLRMPYMDQSNNQKFFELKDKCTSRQDIVKLYNLIEGASICKQNPTDEPIYCTLQYSGYIDIFGQASEPYQVSLDSCEQGVRRFCSDTLLSQVKTFTTNVVNSIESCFE